MLLYIEIINNKTLIYYNMQSTLLWLSTDIIIYTADDNIISMLVGTKLWMYNRHVILKI